MGEVVVKVREGKEKAGRDAVVGDRGEGEEAVKEISQAEVHVAKKIAPVTQKLVRKYQSHGEDLQWV